MLMHSEDPRLDYVLRTGPSEKLRRDISQADQEKRHNLIVVYDMAICSHAYPSPIQPVQCNEPGPFGSYLRKLISRVLRQQ